MDYRLGICEDARASEKRTATKPIIAKFIPIRLKSVGSALLLCDSCEQVPLVADAGLEQKVPGDEN